MSARDYRKYFKQLPSLIGKKCYLTLTANSVKLHIGQNKKNGTFLWVDAPWQFGKDGEIIESSASYPHYEDEDYKRLHNTWCSQFAPVAESTIQRIEASPNGSLWIHLNEGYAFFVPWEFIPENPPLWYDHWYLKIEY